uniref:Superoxide dismutase [Cu-Zn] n=1 Tax=Phaedon cochleariae TaxID=80249 RepID=A0A0S2A472_PHACE|nr:Cu/Zn superoxide dismutase isoform 3 [Phaedon cochleariae]
MFGFAILAALMGLASAQRNAIVSLSDPAGVNGVYGNLSFESGVASVRIIGEVSGLCPGNHGLHIHQYGNIGSGCLATGGHFNPFGMNHGAPYDVDRHVGDLGNIEADEYGIARVDIEDYVIGLLGIDAIMGRGVVVHAGEDDLGRGGQSDSLTTGHAGARLACGVIGVLTDQ